MFLAVAAASKPADATNLDIGKSITIGSGPKTVIEFTDPDCPFCRKASKYFEGRSDVTRHVFFYPLPRHPKAKEKAQYILSQMDRATAYREVMSGKMDTVQKIEGITPKGDKITGRTVRNRTETEGEFHSDLFDQRQNYRGV